MKTICKHLAMGLRNVVDSETSSLMNFLFVFSGIE